jgi:predicted NACHT family NTPase
MSQLLKVEKPYLESRLDLERALEAKLRPGVVLVGGDGSGKTTLIQRMIRTQIAEVMRAPRNARIPVLVEGGKWRDGSVEKALLETMRGYYPVSDGAFQGFLRRGRLICFFEGVDEAFAPRERFEELARFARKYPGNAVVLSVKPRAAETDEVLRRLGLERFDVPPLSEEERAWLQEMKARRAPGA